jgi:hypothetical protein
VTHIMVCRADDVQARHNFIMSFPELRERVQQEHMMVLDATKILEH